MQFNTAELGNRLKRALGLRGSLEEIRFDGGISPTALVLDASGAPYRTNGYRFLGRRGIGALAANLTSFLVCPITGTQVKIVVDSLLLTNDNAAASKFVIGIQVVAASPAAGPSGPFSLEVDSLPSAFATGNVPVAMSITQQVGSLLSAGLTDVWVPLSSTVVIPIDFTIPDGFGLMVETNAVNQALAVGVLGRVFLPV
jgi:hypothetical protein